MSETREIIESEEEVVFTAAELEGGSDKPSLQQRVAEAVGLLQKEGIKGFALFVESEESVQVITHHGIYVKMAVIDTGTTYKQELFNNTREEM